VKGRYLMTGASGTARPLRAQPLRQDRRLVIQGRHGASVIVAAASAARWASAPAPAGAGSRCLPGPLTPAEADDAEENRRASSGPLTHARHSQTAVEEASWPPW
jgi:hypothetical protein